jgi:hypothetical protein
MNWDIILSSAMTSTIVSGFIGLFFYEKQKKVDFQFDYKRYIIEKRKNAYQSVEEIINDTSKFWNVKTDVATYKVHHFMAKNTGKNNFDTFSDKLYQVIDKSIWMTSKIETKLIELVDIINALANQTKTEHLDYYEQVRMAADNFEKIDILSAQINKIYFNDIIQLDDIQRFKSKKMFEHSSNKQNKLDSGR